MLQFAFNPVKGQEMYRRSGGVIVCLLLPLASFENTLQSPETIVGNADGIFDLSFSHLFIAYPSVKISLAFRTAVLRPQPCLRVIMLRHSILKDKPVETDSFVEPVPQFALFSSPKLLVGNHSLRKRGPMISNARVAHGCLAWSAKPHHKHHHEQRAQHNVAAQERLEDINDRAE